MKKYKDLTREEKARICNGCGGKGGIVTPPHAVFFETSCNHHDYGYWKGCTETDRVRADRGLYTAMKLDCSRLTWYRWLRYRPWCWLYYLAIRAVGGRFFYYGDQQREL